MYVCYQMKINERHLIALACGDTPIDKEGFLQKRGEVNRAFQRRWFVLKGNILFYFDKKGDREPNGVIILEGVLLEIVDDESAFTFELVFPGHASRTYVLAAESQDEMESWMKAITCASYDYMKALVADLQRQLDDITVADRITADSNLRTSKPLGQPSRQAPPPPLSNSNRAESTPQRHNPFNSGVAIADISKTEGACSEAILVDVSEAGPPAPPPRKNRSTELDATVPVIPSRINKEADPFYNSAFESKRTMGNKQSEFLKMHEEFGRYICQMMQQPFNLE